MKRNRLAVFGAFLKYTEGKSMVSDTVNCGICVVGKLVENVSKFDSGIKWARLTNPIKQTNLR